MTNKWKVFAWVLLAFVINGCRQDAAPAPTAASPISAAALPGMGSPVESGILFSEVLLGVPGGNQEEFIELYNAGLEPVDLQGYSLWYQLRDNQEPQLIAAWDAPAVVPGQGHYLLARAGHDFGLIPDATFDTPLYEGGGGLRLLDETGTAVDQIGWGETAPAAFVAGSPIIPAVTGGSLERLPGGALGNGLSTGSNADDFILTEAPNPQNSGSDPTPAPAVRLTMGLAAPAVAAPGTEFQVAVTVGNESERPAANVVVVVPLPDHFTVTDLPETAVLQDNLLTIHLGDLAAGETGKTAVTLTSPLTYVDTLVSGHYAAADGFPRSYGPLHVVAVAGGAIPIGAAREAVGQLVTVEGIATMYTGGFFAGSSGAKFYLEDETGGIQVYVPGGGGQVNVDIGDRVRVTGEVEVYRDSLELVPGDVPDDVVVVAESAAEPQPALITIAANETDDAVLGRLNVVTGTATRIEEFTYAYEVDLADEAGNTTLVYIEKDTGVTTEPMDVGKDYRITGISEFYNSFRQLKPRVQTDIEEIYPAVILAEQTGPNSALPGETVTYTVTVRNFTAGDLQGVTITAQNPGVGAGWPALQPDDMGTATPEGATWLVEMLPGGGGEIAVTYRTVVPENGPSSLLIPPATIAASELAQPVLTNAYRTFVGEGVPIWAIQGPGFASPYVRTDVMTRGVVTAVFPELDGFWLQETVSDEDPATSAGLFILMEPENVAVGDEVAITGRVREVSGQTLLEPEEEGVVVLSSGNALPAPAAYEPPVEPEAALAYNESLEGMLVSPAGPAVAIAPTTRYGEYALLLEELGLDEAPRTLEMGAIILVDDGSMAAYADAAELPYTITKGDRVTDLVGPLAFTFDNYKIEPVTVPEIETGKRPLSTLPQAAPDEITLATFNVENLFDTTDPHPADPPKPTRAAYQSKLGKLAQVIEMMGAPTIIGLQEVENLDVLEDLVALPSLADYQYQPYLIEGTDERGIDVAYLVRGDLAVVDSVAAYPAPEGLTSRPPLVLTATVTLASGPETLVVFNNHFTSLAAGEEATEPRRTAQAAWNLTLMEDVLADNPDAQIVVLGDLNSFYQTLPIDTLQAAGLHHAFDIFEAGDPLPYTYIFEGKTQSLDHILMTENLFARLGSVEALSVNADYPLPSPDDDSPHRVSDHDPLVVRFSFSH